MYVYVHIYIYTYIYIYVLIFRDFNFLWGWKQKSGRAREMDPHDRKRPLGDPPGLWDLLRHSSDLPGTPQGPPGASPWTTKTAISQQIYRARTFQLLHPNDFVAPYHPNDSPGLFHHVFLKNRAPFVHPQGPPGGAPSSQVGVYAHGRKESTHKAPGPGSPFHIIHKCIYIYIYMYIYTSWLFAQCRSK